ncbi:Demethylrebeccamycin-D-glucose O-methyltransferase [compost metagenome]
MSSRKAVGNETLERISGALSRYNEWMFAQLSPALGEEILEVGAGIGNLSAFVADRRRVCLTDVNATYLNQLNDRFGQQTNVSVHAWDLGTPAPEALEPGSFDTVICLNVLEHIQDDRAALRRMVDLLKPGGHLALLVPAHAFLYNGLDEELDHFRRYSKPGLRQLLEESGFHVYKLWYFNALGALGWFVNGTLLKKKLLPSGQMTLFDRLVPFLKLERMISLPFGISLIALAEVPHAESEVTP